MADDEWTPDKVAEYHQLVQAGRRQAAAGLPDDDEDVDALIVEFDSAARAARARHTEKGPEPA